jgi:hypothetical protein
VMKSAIGKCTTMGWMFVMLTPFGMFLDGVSLHLQG